MSIRVDSRLVTVVAATSVRVFAVASVCCLLRCSPKGVAELWVEGSFPVVLVGEGLLPAGEEVVVPVQGS